MSVERFIATRLIKGKSHLSGFAKPVLLVSVISTTLGVAVMLLSVFIANGFQNQIRTKVIGFGSHIQVLPFFEDAESGSELMAIDQAFVKESKNYPQIKSIQPVAYKPGIIQRTRKNLKGNREIQGVLFKGIDKTYDKEFLKDHLKEGKLIDFNKGESKDILISKKIASNLSVGIGDTLAAVLISKQENYTVEPDFRKFIVCGIYDTGLEEFDKEYAFIDIAHIQAANGWGINAVLDINDTLKNGEVEIKLNTITTADKIKWFVNGKPYSYPTVLVPKMGRYTFVAADADGELSSDTVSILVTAGILPDAGPNNGYVKRLDYGKSEVCCSVEDISGTSHLYTSGFEINLKNWEDLKNTDKWLYKMIGPQFSTKTIIEQQPQIFNWLELVELNVKIIVLLMLLVAIINLVSAILVLILERSKMIGLLKSFGAANGSVGKIFFYFTANILFRGIIFGNILVFLIYFIQNSTGIIQLNPETYFVSTVPIEIDWMGYVFVNALTIVVCLLAFLLPVMLVSRINPVKAIKIE